MSSPVLLQNAASLRSRVGFLGAGALLAWAALALQLSGVFSFDALHPAMLAGCVSHHLPGGTAPDGTPLDGPDGVTDGITLRRGAETVKVVRGAFVEANDGTRYTLIGLDPAARLVVVHNRRLGLLSLPVAGYTLDVKKLHTGGRTVLIVVSAVVGAVGGAIAGAAIGGAASNGSYVSNALVGGCLGGFAAGGGIGAGTTIVATRDRSYVLAPHEWQIDEGAR